MNETERQQAKEALERRDATKKAEKAELSKHIAELIKLETFDAKAEYWNTHLEHKSLLQGIGGGEERINLIELAANRDERLKVIKAEIQRLDKINKDLLPVNFRRKFYKRIKETPDIELTKTKFIEKIDKHINTAQFPDIHTQYKSKGFDAYDGGGSIESKVEDLQFLAIGVKNSSFFKYTHEGYLLAELQSEIKAYSKSESTEQAETSGDEVQPQSSPLVAALVLKHLGIVEKIAKKENLSKQKVIELLNTLFGGSMLASSIYSSYRDKQKSTNKARKDSLKFLQKIGSLETIESFLNDWKKDE